MLDKLICSFYCKGILQKKIKCSTNTISNYQALPVPSRIKSSTSMKGIQVLFFSSERVDIAPQNPFLIEVVEMEVALIKVNK